MESKLEKVETRRGEAGKCYFGNGVLWYLVSILFGPSEMMMCRT